MKKKNNSDQNELLFNLDDGNKMTQSQPLSSTKDSENLNLEKPSQPTTSSANDRREEIQNLDINTLKFSNINCLDGESIMELLNETKTAVDGFDAKLNDAMRPNLTIEAMISKVVNARLIVFEEQMAKKIDDATLNIMQFIREINSSTMDKMQKRSLMPRSFVNYKRDEEKANNEDETNAENVVDASSMPAGLNPLLAIDSVALLKLFNDSIVNPSIAAIYVSLIETL